MPDDLYEYRWISDPVINTSGTIAYVMKTIDATKNEYVTQIRAVAQDGGDDRPLTDGGKDMAPAWSPDGSQLAFLRMHEGSRQVWVLSMNDGECRPLTDATHGVSAFVWSPDGSRLAYLSALSLDAEREALTLEEDRKRESQAGKLYTRTVPKAEGSGLWNGLHTHLFVLDLSSGEAVQLTSGAFDVAQPRWSPDGRSVAYLAKQVEDEQADPDLIAFNDIFVTTVEDGQSRRVTDFTLAISQFGYSPDGSEFAMIANDRAYGSGTQNRLYTVPSSGGKPEPFIDEFDVQIGNFVLSDMKAAGPSPAPLYGPSGELYAIGTLHGSATVYSFRPDGSYEPLATGERDTYQFALAPDGAFMVTATALVNAPGELFRLNLESGEELRLTDKNDELMGQLAISTPESFWFETAADIKVQAWMMRPAGLTAGEKAPLILEIHGGPHAMYSGTYSHELQCLAAQGYAILFLNPRGSFGYGQEFARAVRRDFTGCDYDDLMAGLDEALSRFDFVDDTRLGVTGGSYGGLMTNWIIAHSDRFQAAVTQRSISNWMSFYGMSDIGISYTEGIVGGNPWENPDLLWRLSPLAHVQQIHTPLLIIHGEQDMRCPVEQADQLYVALKRLGRETALVRYPASNHMLLKTGKPSYRTDVLHRVNDWFVRYLPKEVAQVGRVLLSIPVGMLIENCRSGGVSDEEVIACLKSGDFSPILDRVHDPKMDFAERLNTAKELDEDWERAIREGYSFKFLHIGGLKRLLGFRFGKAEGTDYVQLQDALALDGLDLSKPEADELEQIIHRQWKLVPTQIDPSPGHGTIRIELRHQP